MILILHYSYFGDFEYFSFFAALALYEQIEALLCGQFAANTFTIMSASDADELPKLEKAKHVKYWQRCHKSFLPTAYTGSDSTRLTFAFFIISALDILSVPLTAQDRAAVRTWVLSLQHPDGGFCGSPTHAIAGENASKGSANIAATFFALILLGMAAETEEEQRSAFGGVDRKAILLWLKKLQRSDGSFGQVLWEGEPTGGRDTRHSYLASSIRWMLRGSVQEGTRTGWRILMLKR